MKLLRDLRESTTFLILLEVTTQRHSKLRTLAEKFEMTIQGMSDYVHKMQRQGLIRIEERGLLPTQKGIELLHQTLRAIDTFVRDAKAQLSVIDRCSALAGQAIEAGDRVGLFMENGFLLAYPDRPSNSTGIALVHARKGEVVGVGDLKGIVGLQPGSITIFKVPSVLRGPLGINEGKLRQLARGRLVAALGSEAFAVASLTSLHIDLRFGAIPSTIDAARRGVNVLFILAENELAQAISAIEFANNGTEQAILYQIM